MVPRLGVVLLTLVILASACTDALACGDKFLRAGRSARFRGYASVHPSAILIYAPRWTHKGIAEFENMLRRGGHAPITVKTMEALSHALVGGKYEVVITNFSDAAVISKALDSASSRPALLPVVYNATKAESAEASAAYQCLLRPEKMSRFQALEEIDRLIDLRLKQRARASAAR